jgi:hypothetical protein
LKNIKFIIDETAMDSNYEDSYELPGGYDKEVRPKDKCPEPEKPKFCCTISVPRGLTVIPKSLKAAVVKGKGFKIKPYGDIEKEVCGCKIKLKTIKLSGCAEVFVSVAVKDRSGNISHLCCSSCAFFDDVKITCCDECKNDIEFKVKFFPIKQVFVDKDDYDKDGYDKDKCHEDDYDKPSSPEKACGEKIFQISGKIFTICKDNKYPKK